MTSNDTEQYFEELRRTIQEEKLHPVILIGSADTGKSAMLRSLFRYAALKSGDAILAKPELIPPAHPELKKITESFLDFFGDSIRAFGDFGERLESTRAIDHLLMPIVMSPSDHQRGEPLKFLFLDGNGENIHRIKSTGVDGRERREAHKISSLLSYLMKQQIAMTFIFLSPFTKRWNQNEIDNTQNLHDFITQYISERGGLHQLMDNIVLLINKWDQCCEVTEGNGEGMTTSYPNILESSPDDILNISIGQSQFWGLFRNPQGIRAHRAVSPYSAGPFMDGRPIFNHPQQKDFDHFNRILWSWLYGNASGAERRILYPDVDYPSKKNNAALSPWAKLWIAFFRIRQLVTR